MNADRVRSLLLSFPHVQETMQWGENLVFWVGDKAIGGKMFTLLPLDVAPGSGQPLISFAAGADRYHALLEREGVVPAPYVARIFWVAVTEWGALSAAEWDECLRTAHRLIHDKLPARTRQTLALPLAELHRVVRERRRMLEEKNREKAAAKTVVKAPAGIKSRPRA